MKVQHEYVFGSSEPSHTKNYLWGPMISQLRELKPSSESRHRVLELGCGNGAFAGELSKLGYVTVGVDPSESGIMQARSRWPDYEFHVGTAYDDLRSRLGLFDVVTSLEVVEHVYSPRDYARTIFQSLHPGGITLISTPYHGYWKNLTIAVTGKFDQHFLPLWDHGHIKFWSVATLTALLEETGFENISFLFTGRRYPFSKSMIAVAHKPLAK